MLLKNQIEYSPSALATKLWIRTAMIFSFICLFVMLAVAGAFSLLALIPVFIVTVIFTSPTYLLYDYIFRLNVSKYNAPITYISKIYFLQLVISVFYTIITGTTVLVLIPKATAELYPYLFAAIFFSCAITTLSYSEILEYNSTQPHKKSITKKSIKMEAENAGMYTQNAMSQNNKILIKGIITAVLIAALLIPSVLILNLVEEREKRQQDIVTDVSNKWAAPQTVTSPYLYVTYNANGKFQKQIIVSETAATSADVEPQVLSRSIYNVMLYKSDINIKGAFNFKLPDMVNPASVTNMKAYVCMGITDYKGIDETININFANANYEMNMGLPSNSIDSNGIYAYTALSTADLNKKIAFTTKLKLKGSRQLHFIPLSNSSSYNVSSVWNDPSFDGNAVPGDRNVTKDGFSASWNFNKANMPFISTINESTVSKADAAFGVSLIQPADHYAKTTRSIKYAILFIALTFALFFIIELLQKNPMHPVQYVLVGIALVVFFILLLSISEFLSFAIAYAIAAAATILLISTYTYWHFKKLKIALLFTAILTALYGFIYVLISLEDTSLLIGSIGLFIVLALIMYASRKINWYGKHEQPLTA